jgi:rare lipoprotein A (peptidoglycan hydrolase)/cytoskeletal protein CcmA (bactofilin family)
MLCVAAVPAPAAWCKTPGEVHCYNLTCHRVLTIEETRSRVGSTRILVASYYDDPRIDRSNTGALTSSGEKFDAGNSGRVASSIYPDGTELLLWNPLNGRTAHVRVNDFGPFRSNRTLDLTLALAKRLDVTRQGVTALLVFVVAPPPAEEPLYRSLRTYPKTKGYLGIYEEDALPAVARKLTADSEVGDTPEPADVKIAASIPVPVRKPTPRFGPRDTIRAGNPRAETIVDARPRSALRSLPPLETAVLMAPAPAGRPNPSLALVVARDAGPHWRAPEVRVERLKFAGVWSGMLPRRSPLNVLACFVAALMGLALLQRLSGATAPAMRAPRGPAAADRPLRAPAPAPRVGGPSSFIGSDLQIQGCLISTSDVHVEGQIDGDCVCRQLVIKSAGRLTGDALAEEVIVSGAVDGRILAKTVGLTSRAVVSGDINYCELIVERQATVEARMQKISRACWDETAVEQPRRLPAVPRAVA